MNSTLLNQLSLDDWERIAFYAVVSEDSFLGPPSALCPLSLVSRDIHDVISVQTNSRLYARIFRFKFDYAAPARRLTERWLTTRCLASELIVRFSTLKRIKSKREFRSADLWTCYIMMSESDGKNESQLIDWAGLKSYLDIFIMTRTHLSRPWNVDFTSSSLALWLMWMTRSSSDTRSDQDEHSALIVAFVSPFISSGYRAPSIYGPDSFFNIPLCDRLEGIHPHCSGPPPPRVEIILYSHKVILAAPIVTSAATLVATVRTEALQDLRTFPGAAHSLPLDRAAANALNRIGPTFEDVARFHFQERIHTAARCSPDIEVDFDRALDDNEEEQAVPYGSERYDEDWSRLVACQDPRADQSPLRGKVFTIGSLAGSWRGRLLLPDFYAYMGAVQNPLGSQSVPLHHKPLYWTLREHHCLLPEEPLPAGAGDLGDEDFLNAWLPRGTEIKYLEDAIEVFSPETGSNIRYETYIPNRERPYSQAVSEKLEQSWSPELHDREPTESDSDSRHGSISPNISGSYIDDDDEYEDFVSHKSSGVCDILVTGETGGHHGDSWGHFTIVGRVRPWDGLVVLLRSPRDPDQTTLGEWVFKGYIHDQNLVGRWREKFTPIGMIGFEGAFVVCREN